MTTKNQQTAIDAKIYIAGHRGMVGSAIQRRLEKAGYTNFVTRTSSELDLRDQRAVQQFFEEERPDHVYLAAAKVGGIHANNTYRGEFLYDNLMIQNNVIHSSYKTGVKKLLFLGSSCIYPKLAPQPLQEDYLLTGTLEPTNEPYAIAKIAGIKLCDAYRDQYGCNYISVMPTNLYGPNDNYDLENRKEIVGYEGEIVKDTTKPDGTPRKLMNVDKLKGAGWEYSIKLREGIGAVYAGLKNENWY